MHRHVELHELDTRTKAAQRAWDLLHEVEDGRRAVLEAMEHGRFQVAEHRLSHLIEDATECLLAVHQAGVLAGRENGGN